MNYVQLPVKWGIFQMIIGEIAALYYFCIVRNARYIRFLSAGPAGREQAAIIFILYDMLENRA